jgi:ABC-type transport system involved in multi-copper enzyme maturation permease subunit
MFTTHMAAWRSVFEDPFPTADIIESVVVLVLHIVGLLALTLIRFNKKDITS